ncbi:MAG: tetratricopeptide repeat protein [SAR324 cluster bacterium]|nr:tetratricopeptide repeat protein [SAR324 cluster bacterium]
MASSDIQRKLTAILVTDVVGYSRLMGDDPEGTLKTLTEYREVFSDKIQEYKGRVVNAPGDSILAEFPSVLDAVSCAVDVQRELAERNLELHDTRRMDFRIGVNLGDVLVKDDDLYGDGVNIAARLESLAEPGGICISGKAFEEVKNRLPLHYEFIGEQSVKNIAEPVRTYRILSKPGAAAHRVVQAKRGVARSWRKGLLIAAAGLLLALGAVVAAFFTTSTGRFVWNFYLRPAPSAEAAAAVLSPIIELPDEPSIAVLPFANLSDDPKQEYLADGMTEDIITELSKLRDLLVISRTAVLPYKGKSVALSQIGRELGVRYVLEGSVRISGDRVRITAQLIDVATGSHLWAERYDRKLKDVFAVQDEITGKIVTELDVKLIEGEQARSKHGITDNLEAYEFFRRGMESFLRFTPEGNAQARLLFEKAGALEPDFALGHVWLGYTHLLDVQFWSQSPAESMKRAREEANKSLALDDSLGEAHALLGEVYLNQGQHDKAIAALEEAVSLSPGGADIAAHMARVLNYSGRADEALVQIEKAMRLSPNYPVWYLPVLADVYGSRGQFEEAIAIWKEYIKRTPTGLQHLPYISLAIYYGVLGREKEARAAAAEVLRRKPGFSLEELDRIPFKDRKIIEMGKSLLRKAGLSD